ncbi:MAG: DUF2029 domain-containing protein [Kamptonema sp. SIO4C4]|nr:DUF2029 domain-containing protein [Kamptonema sp. SIO4C4]
MTNDNQPTTHYAFPLLMWGVSRGLLVLVMAGIAPLLSVPEGAKAAEWGWGVFNAWDSQFYEAIAVSGYQFQNDGQGYNVAFFPLLPFLSWGLMQVGLPFNAAATLVNNFALLGALLLLYDWVKQRQGETVARWSTAVLAWCPFSLFGTVIYTEGVFLLVSTAALRAFDRKQHLWAAFWGALATATRVTGVALIPTFLWAAWRQQRGLRAYLAGVFASAGIIGYCLYCYVRFGDFLAFYHSMQAWKRETVVHWEGWRIMFSQILLGPANTGAEGFVDPWHPIAMIVAIAIAFSLWKFRHKVGKTAIYYGYCVLFLLVWLLIGDPLLNTLMILGGLYLLWHTRKELGIVALSYGVFSYGIILNSGQTTSLERYSYAIVSLSWAFGLVLSRYPRWGRAVMLFFGLLLILFGLRFAQHQWVA